MGTHEEPDTSMYWNSDFNKIKALYTQFRAIYPYADISKSSDIAISCPESDQSAGYYLPSNKTLFSFFNKALKSVRPLSFDNSLS
jgi:hypothetical protein